MWSQKVEINMALHGPFSLQLHHPQIREKRVHICAVSKVFLTTGGSTQEYPDGRGTLAYLQEQHKKTNSSHLNVTVTGFGLSVIP